MAFEILNGMAQSEYDIRLIGSTALADPRWSEAFRNGVTPEEAETAITRVRRSIAGQDNHHFQCGFCFYDEESSSLFVGICDCS